MRSLWRLVVGVLLSAACLCASTWAHEEKLAIGEIEAVNLQRNLLVVSDLQTGTTIRLTVDTSTEVKLCRRGLPVSAVQVGQTVRVSIWRRKPGGKKHCLCSSCRVALDKKRHKAHGDATGGGERRWDEKPGDEEYAEGMVQ